LSAPDPVCGLALTSKWQPPMVKWQPSSIGSQPLSTHGVALCPVVWCGSRAERKDAKVPRKLQRKIADFMMETEK
jgi:hypothetical protein